MGTEYREKRDLAPWTNDYGSKFRAERIVLGPLTIAWVYWRMYEEGAFAKVSDWMRLFTINAPENPSSRRRLA